MSLIDADAGTERFGSYEAELKLVQADLNQQLDEIPELSGEPRKAAIAKAERALEEANELVSRQPGSGDGDATMAKDEILHESRAVDALFRTGFAIQNKR